MKRITRIIASLVTLTSLTLVPVTVHAQSTPIVVGDGTASAAATTPAATTTTPATPDTGVAPAPNKAIIRTLVFLGGSTLGAVAALGALKFKSKKQTS